MTYFVQFYADGQWNWHPSVGSPHDAIREARRFHLQCADRNEPFRPVRVVDKNGQVVVDEDDLRLAPPVRR